jgi:hypothetical protein
VAEEAEIRIMRIGKECHADCAIMNRFDECIMLYFAVEAESTRCRSRLAPDIPWRRDALVAFSRKLRDEGVASPANSCMKVSFSVC